MSRRITLSVIAACAALSATPAFADNDCFDQTACPPTEETLAREQRMLEDRARELREQEAQTAADALAKQRAEEQRTQELAAQEAATRAQAVETQRAMERAAAEQAKREEAAAARAAQEEAAHDQQYAREREAEEQRAAERRAQQIRAAEQQRMPNVTEPPAVVVQTPAAAYVPPVVEASQAPKETPKEAAAPRPIKQPTILGNTPGIVPPVSTVPAKKIARPAEQYEEPAYRQKPAKRVADAPRPAPVPVVQPAPSTYEEPREPVRAVQRAPIITGSVPVHSPVISAPVYVNQGPPAGTIVVVKGATYEDGMTPAVAGIRPDPVVKYCQNDQRADGRYVYCNEGSYHPYGVNGYRPMGTYKTQRTTPAYIAAAPGPRIISLQGYD
jgi:hypothetical protein